MKTKLQVLNEVALEVDRFREKLALAITEQSSEHPLKQVLRFIETGGTGLEKRTDQANSGFKIPLAMTTPTPTPAIDFAAIRSTCPRAFAVLVKWTETVSNISSRRIEWIGESNAVYSDMEAFWLPKNSRDLYDFFDGQGVYVHVRVDWGRKGVPCFGEVIETADDYVISELVPTPYHTRAEAETAAFRAAFERLEEKLNL